MLYPSRKSNPQTFSQLLHQHLQSICITLGCLCRTLSFFLCLLFCAFPIMLGCLCRALSFFLCLLFCVFPITLGCLRRTLSFILCLLFCAFLIMLGCLCHSLSFLLGLLFCALRITLGCLCHEYIIMLFLFQCISGNVLLRSLCLMCNFICLFYINFNYQRCNSLMRCLIPGKFQVHIEIDQLILQPLELFCTSKICSSKNAFILLIGIVCIRRFSRRVAMILDTS